ncbi:MAG: undecaprenyl-diphosphate phosphatase [Clostridia bacterium]|nr:undecaprenyl-diphosphate phosphatase [Clostridia bacterium]
MDNIQAFILGIVQGLTEFLPISSSGHLTLFQKMFGLQGDVFSFDVAVHMATLMAVFFVFWKDILDILKKPFGKFSLLIIVGAIPTIAIGLLFKDFFEGLYESGVSLGIEFIFTGMVLWYAESAKGKGKGLEKTTYADAALIGVAQGVAILPAVSRSGLTIAAALFKGLDREFAAKFSFLVSIPPILGATMLDILKLIKGTEKMEIGYSPMIIGMVAAAVSGYLAVKFMIKIISKGKLRGFSYYVFLLGGLILVDQLFTGIFFEKFF